MRKPWQRSFRFILAMLGLALLLIVACQFIVTRAAKGRLYDAAAAVPERRVALLLGCTKKLKGGRSNAFFNHRIHATAKLYRAGKLTAVIVSGDNHREGYDEPTDMREALIADGVPEAMITCDYAGFRTLDSVARAKKVFGQKQLLIISQRFHNERALYLAKCYGIDAFAFNATDVSLEWALKTYLREAFARVKAVLDMHVLHTQPRFLGKPVEIMVSSPTSRSS